MFSEQQFKQWNIVLIYTSPDECLGSAKSAQVCILGEDGEDILYLASSLNKNAQTLAASSGWPILDSGTRLKTSNFPDSTPPKPATIGVLNIPLFLCQPVRNCRDKSPMKGTTAFAQVIKGAKSAIPTLSAILEIVDLRCDTIDPNTSPSHLTCRTLT